MSCPLPDFVRSTVHKTVEYYLLLLEETLNSGLPEQSRYPVQLLP
jgi:hypothetical protein